MAVGMMKYRKKAEYWVHYTRAVVQDTQRNRMTLQFAGRMNLGDSPLCSQKEIQKKMTLRKADWQAVDWKEQYLSTG
jgi:hypothetical protein